MTSPVYFANDRSSAVISTGSGGGVATAPAVLRAYGAFQTFNANNVVIPWPAGTVAGDMVVIAVCQGNNVIDPPGWKKIQYTYNIWWNTAIYCKVMDAADITAGSVTVSFTNGYYGCAAVASYEDGADLDVALIGARNTPAGSSVTSYSIPFDAGNERSYFVFATARANITVSVSLATSVVNGSGANMSGLLGLYNPGSDASVTETASYSASGQGNFLAVVSVAYRGAKPVSPCAGSGATGMSAIGNRFANGALYFEAKLSALVGTMGVGFINAYQGISNAVLGSGVHNLVYRNTGLVVCNGSTLATISNYVAGDIIGVAYHPGTRQVWFRVNGGSWNNDGTANPATFVGGIDIGSFYGGAVYPAVEFSTANGFWIGMFAEDTFSYTMPSGYTSIENDTVTGVGFDCSGGQVPGLTGDNLSEWRARTDLPDDNHSAAISFPAGPVKTIAGEVQEESIGVEGRLVRLYNRRTGDYVGEARTNALGEFVIPARDPSLPHFVVAFDDDIAPDYNAKIYDNVIPQ